MSGPTRLRPMHEQLKGYLAAEGGLPTEVAAPDASPRHPMAPPNKRVPKGRRPIPASSEGPKKTNAQIPYARLLIKTMPEGDPLNRVRPGEGDVVFVERNLHYTHAASAAASRLGSQTGSLCRVRTLQDLNRELSATKTTHIYVSPRSLEAGAANDFVPLAPGVYPPSGASAARAWQKAHVHPFPWTLDGVINNVDGDDPGNEYKDYTLANVAIQGQCRLRFDEATRGPIEPRATHTLAVVMVGLLFDRDGTDPKTGAQLYTHRLVRFTSAEVARDDEWHKKLPLAAGVSDTAKFTMIWTVGKVLDAKQAPDMITVHVDVNEYVYASLLATCLPSYQIATDTASGTQVRGIWNRRRPHQFEPSPDDVATPNGDIRLLTDFRNGSLWGNYMDPSVQVSERFGKTTMSDLALSAARKRLKGPPIAAAWP
jgi:hypothetical protein